MGDLGLIALPAFAFDEFDAAIEVAGNDVPVMEEGIFFEADVDKGGLEAIFEIANFAFENAANEALFSSTLDGEFFEFAFFQNSHARFKRFGVDDDFFVGAFDRFDEALNFLDNFIRGGFEALDQTLRLRLFEFCAFSAAIWEVRAAGNLSPSTSASTR